MRKATREKQQFQKCKENSTSGAAHPTRSVVSKIIEQSPILPHMDGRDRQNLGVLLIFVALPTSKCFLVGTTWGATCENMVETIFPLYYH